MKILANLVKLLMTNNVSAIRVEIKEDENFGEAIIEEADGTPSTYKWDNDKERWI